MLEGRFEHFATFSDFLRRSPKTSEDFQKIPKIFKIFGNLSECLFLHSRVLFPKLSKEFPNIQQRRHEPLLPVTDRPLNFSFTLLISNHRTFSFNLKLLCTHELFKKFKFNSPCGLVKSWYSLKNSLVQINFK